MEISITQTILPTIGHFVSWLLLIVGAIVALTVLTSEGNYPDDWKVFLGAVGVAIVGAIGLSYINGVRIVL